MNPLATFWTARWGGPLSRAQIDAAQRKGFARLRRIMARSPFYAAYAARPFDDWPPMDKAGMMADFSRINTQGISRDEALELALRAETSRDFSPMLGKIALGLSTGTSGQRGLFASNPRERALWAAMMLGRFLPRLLARQRIAFFLRANNRLYESLSNPLIDFRFYDLLDGVEPHFARLNDQDPSVLIAPAQVLCQLAQAQLDGRIALLPQVVISVAEVASPEDAALVARAFRCPMDQVYQCTEGVLGMTCKAGNLHLNEGHLHIEREIVDPQSGAFIPVITDLARETQPIIRYRLDDVLVPDPDPCPCGCARLRLSRIEGRADDMIRWRGETGGQVLVPSDMIRQAVAGARAVIRDYRAEQFGTDHLLLALDTIDPQAGGEVAERLRAQARHIGAIAPQISLRPRLLIDPSVKRRRVINRPAAQLSAALSSHPSEPA